MQAGRWDTLTEGEFELYLKNAFEPAMLPFMRHVAVCPPCLRWLADNKDSMGLGMLQLTGDEVELGRLLNERLRAEVNKDGEDHGG